jgi:hypothetical protein
MVTDVASSRIDASNYAMLLCYCSADVAWSDPAGSNYVGAKVRMVMVYRRE